MNSVLAPRVLLVEDDANFRETVRDTLRGGGYEVDEAADGLQAVERVVALRPDLVLLDFDLPRMMGDEALEQMLALRPGLVCYVLSGKDDLHQALWMGRRGAYGWIDKYVGSQRLLQIVAEGLRLRPQGFDLRRLIAGYYPQPIALQYARLARLAPASPAAARLAMQRDLFEALAQYLGVAAIAVYLERGLLADDVNRQLVQAIQSPTPAGWLEAAGTLARLFAEGPHRNWQHELARTLLRPSVPNETLSRCQELTVRKQAIANGSEARSPLGLLGMLADFHALWITPERLPRSSAPALADALGCALDELLASLAVLADAELLYVQEVILGGDGSYAPQVAALSGLGVEGRELTLDQRPVRGELYFSLRKSNQLLAKASPLYSYGPCEPGGLVPQGVYGLAQWTPDRGAMYYSYGCGHVRLDDSPQTLAALRHLFYSLDPGNNRFGRLLQNVAVALFDLSGYTHLTRTQGPAVAREAVRRMVSAVREAAQRHQGRMAEPVGDEVLVSFDDPQHAVQAAVETLATLAELNARNREAPLRAHVGLDYGPGIVEQQQVWGDVINRAKRCQTIAGPDEIVVSDQLAAAISESSTWTLEKLTGNLKGFGEVDVFQVRWRGHTEP